ncbi:MAG: 50S ribosomal protein L9 [Calditrichaeota bacterium]|nr:50S ribosomal protein L9 [Calditrichota bacterium]MCB0290478.1 50S ribosomal protein L9 [Calditrichota bacterium]MCB0295283.1 50S ribosomal protein L9 [Calditrichota bacterium]MCB0303021.1 50S ribosomal protein L9 [Calditrichota bacterium]MCB9090714.1 50S ribosomal protein L9 [Calditrichia bacterium]
MKIILRQDYENLGNAGDVVKVKPGFARNYLLPKKIAYPAQPNYLRMIEEEKRQKEQRQRKEKKLAEAVAEKLSAVSVTISASVGEEDKMFGSVTSQDIADELAKQGYEIDRRKIVLEEPIKALGIYQVPIKLYSGVEANVKVWVVKE